MIVNTLLVLLGIAALIFLILLWFGLRWTRAKKKAEKYVRENKEEIKRHYSIPKKKKKFSVAPRYQNRRK